MRRLELRSWVAVVGTLSVAACGDVFTSPFSYGTVDVEVTLADGAGLPGVDLVLYSGTRHLGYGATDDSGQARFDFVPEGPLGVRTIPPPEYRPADHPDGYHQTFRMREGRQVRLSFAYVDARGAIVVFVEDGSGTPIPGLEVEVYDARETLFRTRLGSDGRVEFEGLRVGDYGVRVFESGACPLPPDGYVYRDGLLVEPGARIEVRLTLSSCG